MPALFLLFNRSMAMTLISTALGHYSHTDYTTKFRRGCPWVE